MQVISFRLLLSMFILLEKETMLREFLRREYLSDEDFEKAKNLLDYRC